MDMGDSGHGSGSGVSEEHLDHVFGPDSSDDQYYYDGDVMAPMDGEGDMCDHLDTEGFSDEPDEVPTEAELKEMVTSTCVCHASKPCDDAETMEAFTECYYTAGGVCACMSDEVV